ncbi:MAG: DEAD/DEAH box helicase [Anaerolineales bacterium]|nr:DEAD/DEAH box helicase [Anaerolineales bacterium]MCB8959237.1 DEAD/DEAH box helicase [Ardenticatenales bacterium]
MSTQFSDLGLVPELVQTVSELGYSEPTPIQCEMIPVMLTGRDVIGQAQTGTGKTAAFSLPIIQRIEADLGTVQALVVAPTRELALQVAEAMTGYGAHINLRVLPIYGGQPYGPQRRALRRGVDVVVGTPGRLIDLIESQALDLAGVNTVVLDEADEMLSMGFIEDVEKILQATPAERQTALFSATMPGPIQELAERYLQDPHKVTVARQQLTVAAIEQRYYLVNEEDRLAALTRLFEVEEISRAIIFARTRIGTGELANELTVRGFPAEALNGDLSQDARERVLDRFRNDQLTVLVATDVAARGLDIDDVSHVINYELPNDPEVYVHRIGRTGRAGKSGIAISLLTLREMRRLRLIERIMKQKLTEADIPSEKEIKQHRNAELERQLLVWLRRDRCQREKEMVTALVEDGHDLLSVAAVALKLARAEEKQRPIAPVNELRRAEPRERQRRERRGPRENGSGGRSYREPGQLETGMVRLALSQGKADGLRAGDVVGTVAATSGIPGASIGRITIGERRTLLDVPAGLVEQVLSPKNNYRIRRQQVTLERA